MSIIVVVTNANAITPARVGQAGLLRNISKSAVSIVVIETVRGRMSAGRESSQQSAVWDKGVNPTIIVVIVKRNPRSIGLKDVLFFALFPINNGEGETALGCDVAKGHRPRAT